MGHHCLCRRASWLPNPPATDELALVRSPLSSCCGCVIVTAVEGESHGAVTSAPTAIVTEAPHLRDLSPAGQYLTRLLGVVTAVAFGLLVLVAWRANAAGEDFEMTGLTMPMLLVGLFWLATFLTSMWMVRLEWSGLSLALVIGALGTVGYLLGRAVPPESTDAPMYFGLGAGELAVELQFSLICAFVVFVVWAVWASMPVARRAWSRPAVIALGVGLVVLCLGAWNAVPSYPSGY